MFRPPSLLSPRSFLPLRILLQGSRGFYVRAYRALLPPHAPDMLTVRIQVIDGTGTFTQSNSQPCRLLTSLHGRYSISSLLRPIRHPLAFDRFPGLAGYTIYLAPVISPRDEEGFASYSVCPCYRAVAFTPPRWRCRIGQISAPHSPYRPLSCKSMSSTRALTVRQFGGFNPTMMQFVCTCRNNREKGGRVGLR